jgi:hypothetical protein
MLMIEVRNRLISGGASKMRIPLAELNSSGWRLAWRTSSYLVSAQ